MNVITNPISNIPLLKNSHVLGWSLVWAEQLGAEIDHRCSPDIDKYEKVFLEHGVNFGGTLNLFGGATKEIYERINRVMQHPNVVSLDYDMPPWGEQLRKRIGAPTTCKEITNEWCNRLSERIKGIPSLKQENLQSVSNKFTGISVGDSHTPAFSQANDIVLRANGKTLFGSLGSGIITNFRGLKPFGEITLSFGSIDIRHHLLRHAGVNLDELISEYVKQGQSIEKTFACEVFYCAPVPVEHEGRKLPQTGYFKGTPFFGSREERLNMTLCFIDLLNKKSGGKVVKPPETWYNMDGEEYAKKYMENASSVHISPQHYRRKNWE
jgi:hypothetical protein